MAQGQNNQEIVTLLTQLLAQFQPSAPVQPTPPPVAVPVVPDPKPGYQTSEFWLTLLTGIASMIPGLVPAPWGPIAAAAVTAVYTVSRGMAKKPTLVAAPTVPALPVPAAVDPTVPVINPYASTFGRQ